MAPSLTCACLLLIGLATSAVAGPVNSRYNANSECASFCPENTKFGFETGKTYEYDYESEVKTHIPGASTDHSSLHMNALVKLEVLSRCEMALVLENVGLDDVAPGSGRRGQVAGNRQFADALQRQPLRFAFVSGHIESLCPSEAEETWVLNMKRGILSGFQNNMNDFYTDLRLRETDISGECPVTYTTQGAGWNGVYTIKKTKNIEACQNRLSADTIFQGTAYKTPSKMQSLPVLKGSHECEQKINKQGILTESSCSESHMFRPFAKGNSGATTDIKTKLTFKRETTGIVTSEGPIGAPMWLSFSHEKTEEELIQNRRAAEDALSELCSQIHPVTARAPELFGKLVTALKKLDSNSLISLHRDSKGERFCKHAEKYLHDAIPTIGTAASARLISDLILNGEVTGVEEALWLNSLAFVQNPSSAMLSAITPLLKTDPLKRSAALSISSLVNNYCRVNSGCSNDRAVQEIVNTLGAHLVGGCRKASTHHDEVMMSLKAIGNTGHAETIADSINMCIRNAELDIETRVAAIQAFRRMACTADRSELTSVFENAQMDSELRINAYLSLMACPTEDILRRVRNQLTSEEINQVGSFIWTHLTNLMETSSPLKQEIRQIVEIESLRKEFNMDKRKFSRNVEKSYFSDMLNSGASFESNLIWSSESFVPRSASVNLTADLFGHSVNLVEVGGRVEGINSFLDKIFDKNTPAEENMESTNEINEINNKAKVKRETDPKGSAYMRIFGNEISYVDFHDLDADTIKEKFNYLNWLIELAKEHSIDYSKSFQFLDTTVTVATIAGFPLRLNIQGNAVTDIKMSGKFDIRSMAAAPRSMAIDGSFAPSASLEITAEMGIDAFVTRSGLRTVDNLHTSTVAEGRITLRDGKIFEMDIKTPMDKMEVFSLKHDFFVIYRDQPHEIAMTGSKFEYTKCIGGTFSKVTGMEVCGIIAVPNQISEPNGPFFPLASAGEISFIVNKKDTFTGYHFEAKALREEKRHEGHRDNVDIARVSFNTPGSRVNREITMDFSLNHSEKQVSASLITPWSPRTQVQGSLTDTPDLKRANAVATVGSARYEAVAEMVIRPNDYNTRYEPKFELILPNNVNPKVSGHLLYRAGRKIDLNMDIENIFRETVEIKGTITGVKQSKKLRYETELNIKSPIVNGKVNGFIDRTSADGDVHSSRLEIMYKPTGGVRNRLTFSGKLRNKSSGKRTDVYGTMAFTSSAWSSYNTDLNIEVKQQGRSLTTSFEGKLAGSQEKSIKIEQSGTLALSGYNKKANLDVDFKFPYMNMDYNVKLNHEHKKDLLKSSAVMTRDGRQYGILSLDMTRESASPLKAAADVKLHYPGRRMRYTQTIEEVSKGHYTNDLALQLQADQIIHLTADYKMQPRHEIQATLTSPFHERITFNGHLKPVIQAFEMKAAVEHSGNTYSGEATLNHKAALTRAEINLIHPRRTVTSEIELKSSGKTYTGTFDAKWDAARDANKRVSLNAEITLAKMRPALNIKAQIHPDRFIEVTSSGEFIHRSDRCNLKGDFNFKSSIEHLEEITASFKHKKTSTQMAASAQLTFAPRKKIDTSFTVNLRNGWESVDANAVLTTPFTAVRKITYELDYAKESNTFRANTKGMFNRHSIGFVASGTATLPNIDGSITMTTTFSGLESVTLKANHVDTGLKCHCDAELSWAAGKKIAMIYNGEHSRSGYYLNSNGDISVTTPFKGFRTNKVSWKHSNDAGSVKHHTEVEMYKQKAAFDLDANIVSSGPGREFHVQTTLKAPSVDIAFNANHEHSLRHIRGMKTDISAQWAPGKAITATQTVGNLDNTGLAIITKFTSPFEGFETITIDLNNRLLGNKVTARNEIKWPAATISLDGDMVYQDTEFDGSFELSTPYFPKQKLTVMSKQEGDHMITRRTYQYAPNKVMSVSEDLGLGKVKSYNFEFKSPCPYLEVVNFNMKHDGDFRDFTSEIDFFSNLMKDKFELMVKASTSDLADMKLNINMKSPFRPLRFLRTMYSHKIEGSDFAFTGSFHVPSYKATFNHDMNIVSWRRFNTKSAIMYRPGEKIEFTTRFQASRKIAATATLKTPFQNMEDLSVSFNHEGPWHNMKTSAEVNLDKTSKISSEFEFQMEDGIHCFATVNTPFRAYKNLGFTFNLGMAEKKMDWSVYVENFRFAGQNVISWRENHLSMSHSVQTPYSGYESILLTLSHEGSLSNFKQEGVFEYPRYKFTLNNDFSINGRDISAKSEIRTPFRTFGSFILEASHKGHIGDFSNSISVILDGQKYDATSSFQGTTPDFKLDVKVHIPREFTLTLNHEMNTSGGTNKVVVLFNERRMSAETKFLHRGRSIEAGFILLTPFEGYEKFYFDGKHNGPWNNFNCKYILEVFGRRMTVTDDFKLKGDQLVANLDITTPFRAMTTFTMQVNHDGRFDDFKNNAIVTINGNRYSTESEFKLLDSSVSLTAAVNIPQEYRVTFTHAGSMRAFTNSLELKMNREVYSGQSEFRLEGGHVDASATLNTPSSQPRKVSFKFDHEGTPTNFQQEATFAYGSNTFFTKTVFELEGNDVKAEFELKTPFEAVRSFVIDANHEGKNMKNFRNNLDIILNGVKRSVSSDFKWFSSVFKLKVDAKIPEQYSILIKNKGSRSDFAASVLVNTPSADLNSNCNFKLTDDAVTSSLSINTPFRFMRSQSITFEAKKLARGFTSEAKIVLDLPDIKNIEIALNHNGNLAKFNTNGKLDVDSQVASFVVNHEGRLHDFTCSASVTIVRQTWSGQVNFKKVNNKIEAGATVDVPIARREHWAVTFNHDGVINDFQTSIDIDTPLRGLIASYNHKGSLNNFECEASIESEGEKYTGEWKFKHMRGDVDFSAEIKTPIRAYEEFAVVFKHDNTANGLKTTLEIKTPFRGFENMNAHFSHNGPSTDFHTVGVINIPSHPLKFDLTHQGIRSDFTTNGFIQYAARKYSMAKSYKYADGNLETTGSFEMPGNRRYAYVLNHKFSPGKACTTKGSIETPHRSYERASFDFKHKGDWYSFETEGSVKPFQGEGSFRVNHQRSGNEFTSSANAAWNDHTISGEAKHRGNMGEFESSASASWNDHRVSGNVNHRGGLNDFATSVVAQYNDQKFLGNVNHRGNRGAFTSTASAEFDNKRITGNAEYKNEDGNIDASTTVETPFTGYERFHATAKHSLEGKKLKTEVALETPFRTIRNPSFEIQHRGHWKNFKTTANIVAPFKSVRPVTISINHRGIPKDFTSSANVEYGRDRYTGSATYKRTPTSMSASGEITTPFAEAKKYAANFDYSMEGNNFNTKSQIETPHATYDIFGVEINHEGDLNKFETSGKIDTPLTEQPILFNVNHAGRLTNFKSSGSIESAGRKIEGEASYKKTDGYYEADHDASIRISTPYRHLRTADMTLKHAHNDGVWSGNLKGSYNGETFDGDYSIANKARKSMALTIREPRPMEYTATVHPSSGQAEASINWDARTSNNQMKFEATLKNEVDNYKVDRQVTMKVTCHRHVRSLMAGYVINGDKFETTSTLQWGNSADEKISHEMDITRTSRGRATVYDGHIKVNSPVVNFNVEGNHQINPNRRYVTEIKLITEDTLQVRSDIKTPKGDYSEVNAAFHISEPRLTKPVVIEIDSKIDPDTTLYDGRIDLEYAAEKITFTGKIADQSNRYRTRYLVESSLKHPSNDLDMTFKSFILANKKEFTAESSFDYMMSRTRDVKTMSTSIHFDKITEEAKIEVSTPVKSFDITGRRTINDANRQHFSVSGSVGRRSMQAEIDMDKTIPGIDMTLEYAPEKTLHMYGKYLSPDHFQINAYRQLSGRKIPELTFDTEIVAGNLIKSRAFLRPSLVSDFSDLFSTNSGLGRLYNQATQAIATDLRLKAPGVKRAAAPMLDAMESVANDMARIAVRFERTFNRMYSRNDYYTRDLVQSINGFFSQLRTDLDIVVEKMADAITHIERVYQKAAVSYDQWRLRSVRYYNEVYSQATSWLSQARRTLQAKMDQHFQLAQSSLLDLVNYVRTHPRVQALFDRIQAEAERIIERIDELMERMYDRAKELLACPKMDYVRKYINNANAKVAWVAEYINLEERAHEFIHHLKETGFGPLRRTIWRTIRDYFHFDETKITTWAPERGEVAGQIYIPATMRDLRSFPTFKISSYFDNIKRFIPDTNWVFWDTLYAYKPTADIRDWIPPFKSHATISGTQHYMTFDKKFFEFAGECSYLLAHDMIDNSFSVAVNYKSGGVETTKKSITVVHGNDQVEILPEFRVEVNGRRSEMPIISQHMAVYRVGNTLRIDNDHGVKIACNLPHDHCTVSVTGWYFAKTGGLLGTYDNEPATDFKMPNGEMANTPEQLASSWTVGKQCRSINRANNNQVNSLNPNYQRCKAIFQEETSSFRPCFKQIQPEPFMTMCMNGDVCNVASFYVHECGNHDVPIRMPRDCVTCELPSGRRLSEGQEETLSASESNKADIVFVISHGDCNQDAIEKIEMLANQVQKGMKEVGIRNVKFGIVGYGGSGREAEPHSHTMDGQLMNTKTTFIQTIRNFQTSGQHQEDPLSAIRFASNYPFRAGASKSIILVPCEKCTTKATPYSVIQEVLSEQDIRFHMLIHQDFELRASTKSPKTSYMFGLDRASVYTNKDVGASDISGDPALRRHTMAPKDLCVALTHESDGSVFNILKLTQTKTIGQKRFADVFSRVLAKKGTPSECQVCECRSDETGVGVSLCRSCEPAAPYVYSWDHIEGLPEPEVVLPKKGRMYKKSRRN